MTYDAINAIFELVAGSLLLLNIKEVYKRKSVVGVSLLPAAFFTIWGIWNAIYYPAIGQKLSFYAGLVVIGANGIWVIMALYYRKNSVLLKHKIKRV